ncbi:hypothetical protein RhiirA4_500056 [Rhizophagus irregularis]|uniref:Beta-Casp domain-containing protein n=1 Tax=Rhizophagus irregularis TaxID=588596 RepID=A0A2I1H504_9GLOM|nr:hypothetical protein RhiirA4_500056 [Rhizophagus irregularis]
MEVGVWFFETGRTGNTIVRIQMMKELVHFFGDSVLKSRTHSQPGFTNIFTGVTADWNVARSLYSIADIQSCIDKVRPVRFGEHLITIVSSSSTVQNKHPLSFDETFFESTSRAVGLRGIPFYAVSPHICGEWMCTERQQKMYLPDNLMHHQDMIEQSLLYYASRADSSLQKKYQEPCVVFAGHPSLRSGAAINFIRKWVFTNSLIASLNGTLNIHNTKTSLTSAENQLNQQRYVCGEFNVSKVY